MFIKNPNINQPNIRYNIETISTSDREDKKNELRHSIKSAIRNVTLVNNSSIRYPWAHEMTGLTEAIWRMNMKSPNLKTAAMLLVGANNLFSRFQI